MEELMVGEEALLATRIMAPKVLLQEWDESEEHVVEHVSDSRLSTSCMDLCKEQSCQISWQDLWGNNEEPEMSVAGPGTGNLSEESFSGIANVSGWTGECESGEGGGS